MGRLNLNALRVHQATSNILRAERQSSLKRGNDRGATPAWFDVVESVPPAQILIRTQPVQHGSSRRRSKMFKPQPISYAEDRLRKQFFQDHPWELARPRIVLEQDGRDHEQHDWSELKQIGRQTNGESVIQRQKWIEQNDPSSTSASAYDQARYEFYALRLQEDVELSVAREEALANGAYFGLSALEIGSVLEDKAYEYWKLWAVGEVKSHELTQSASYTSTDDDELGQDAANEADSPSASRL